MILWIGQVGDYVEICNAVKNSYEDTIDLVSIYIDGEEENHNDWSAREICKLLEKV